MRAHTLPIVWTLVFFLARGRHWGCAPGGLPWPFAPVLLPRRAPTCASCLDDVACQAEAHSSSVCCTGGYQRRHHCLPMENAWFSKPTILQVGKMTAVNHPCIVRCFGMLEPTPGIVLELVDGGSLFQIIHARRDESFAQYEQRLPWPVRQPTQPLVASRLAPFCAHPPAPSLCHCAAVRIDGCTRNHVDAPPHPPSTKKNRSE